MSHENITDDDIKPVRDRLNTVRQLTGYGWARVFGDWTELVVATLRRNDDVYMGVVDRYEGEYDDAAGDCLEVYSEAFAELVAASQSTEADIIGAVHQNLGIKSERSGQFFTDNGVAQLMAGMMFPDGKGDEADDGKEGAVDDVITIEEGAVADATDDDPLSVADIACGSARLLVGARRQINRLNPECPVVFTAQDSDPVCAQMAVINFVLHGLPGYVVHGDTLMLEATTTYEVRPSRGLIGGPIRTVDVNPQRRMLENRTDREGAEGD